MRPCRLCFLLGGIENGFLVSVGELQGSKIGIIASIIVQYLHIRCSVLKLSWWGKEQAMGNIRIYYNQLDSQCSDKRMNLRLRRTGWPSSLLLSLLLLRLWEILCA